MRYIYILVLLFIANKSFSQIHISREEAKKDIDFFNQTLQEVHCNPYEFISKEKYYKKVMELKESLNDSVPVNQLIFNLYQLTSSLKDGHTMPALLQPVIKNELSNDYFFPFILVRNRNKLYVPKSSASQMNMLKGTEILSINGYDVAKLLKSLDKCFGGTKAYTEEMTMRLLPYLMLLKGIRPPYNIKYKDKTGKTRISKIENGINFKNALTLSIPSLKTAYSFQIIDNKLAYFRFLRMSGDLNAFDHYVDSCVVIIKKDNIQHLAIDIRDNSGGNSIFADLLISYFYSKNYTLMSKKEWKISQPYKNYLIASGDTTSEYLSKTNGTIWKFGSCEPQKPLFENNNVFSGKVFLITGAFTFSSANMFADGVKQFKMAEIIGTNTGENTTDFGEAFTIDLPFSKIKMQVTTSFDYGVDCRKKTYSPVKPDEKVVVPLKYKIEEEDIVLKRIIEKIK